MCSSDLLLVTFLGWEGVGTCSYFLISFWHERDSAATAGKKAFVTNRVGDWGFMMAMFFALWSLGSLDYLHLSEHASSLSTTTATAIARPFRQTDRLSNTPVFYRYGGLFSSVLIDYKCAVAIM